jgi:hypothetical protein
MMVARAGSRRGMKWKSSGESCLCTRFGARDYKGLGFGPRQVLGSTRARGFSQEPTDIIFASHTVSFFGGRR